MTPTIPQIQPNVFGDRAKNHLFSSKSTAEIICSVNMFKSFIGYQKRQNLSSMRTNKTKHQRTPNHI